MRTLVFGRALAIAVLVATMLAWAPAVAQNVDPLTLELASSRGAVHGRHADRAELEHRRRQAALHADH